jgi:hypothetical protein
MKPDDSTGELLIRITNTMVIIKDNYAAYQNKVAAPQQDTNRGYLDATATKWRNNSVSNAMQFFKMQLFWAALPGEIHNVVAQEDQTNITLDDMYQIATTVQRESGSNTLEAITSVKEENKSNKEDEDDVAAFQNQKTSKRTAVWSNYTSRQNCSSKNRARSGNNANRNGKYCYYCKIQNHRQEECRKRISEHEPCKHRHGRAYWPKAYVIDTNSGKSEQKGQEPVFQ